MEGENTTVSDISTNFETTCVPAKRNDTEDSLEKSMSAVSVGREELESRFLNQIDGGQTGR
jgi:hypothetical protein